MGLQDSPGVWKHSMKRFVTREMPNKTMKPACSDPRKSPIQMGRTSLSHILDTPSPIEATLSGGTLFPHKRCWHMGGTSRPQREAEAARVRQLLGVACIGESGHARHVLARTLLATALLLLNLQTNEWGSIHSSAEGCPSLPQMCPVLA